MIEIKALNKIYKSKRREKKVLSNINLLLPNNGIVGISGESGFGKSTLIDIISGSIDDYDGDIYFNEKNYRELGQYEIHTSISYLKQNEALIPYLTVKENFEYFYQRSNIEDLLKFYHIDITLDKYPNEISGGERQRIAILQAILEKKRVLLLDEPTSALDDVNSETIMKLIQSVANNVLIIIICHDKKIIERYCNRIIELTEGKISSDYNINPINNDNLIIPQTKDRKSVG